MSISKGFLDKYGLPTFEHYCETKPEYEPVSTYYYMIFEHTDHIPLKIFETFIENMATASIMETIGVIVNFFKDVKLTYADVLAARKAAREELNKLEQATE